MRLHVVVRGRVQGVGFRWFVREQARSLGLAGWVTNRSDGAVEAEADGSEAALSEFHQALAQGPRNARVDEIEALAPTARQLGNSFTIER
ncbi:MAG TPA: acylphosphatase [Gemmatimonadaceae bacterium]|nr:acylphosphatase [Gemmatimonadaceae bacterium]